MPYVKTAWEGVERLCRLIDRYGSAEGNAVVFADADEIGMRRFIRGINDRCTLPRWF